MECQVRSPKSSRHVDRERRREQSAAAIMAFMNLAEAWDLSKLQRGAVLGIDPKTPYTWQAGHTIIRATTLERIVALTTIYVNLHAFFGDTTAADAWVHRPNAAFGGRRPIDALISGHFADTLRIRDYTDAMVA
jgi:hypothetical protein